MQLMLTAASRRAPTEWLPELSDSGITVKSTFLDRVSRVARVLVYSALLCGVLRSPVLLSAQTPAAANNQRLSGVVTKVDPAGPQVTLKTDAGVEVTVSMAPRVSYRRVEPGETDLTKAATIAVTDIGAGDRVLAVGAAPDEKSFTARLVVVMSKADIASKESSELADWQKRGVIGIVTAVSGEEVTISVRGPGGAKPLVITPAPKAVIRRYTSESVKFQDAAPSTLAEVKTGDQVRARGDKSPDGGKMTADEIVSGTFKEIAATVLSIDPVEKVMRVRDLATKNPITLKITADSNLRKLPPQMAQMLAAQNRPPEDNAGPGGRGGGAPQGRGGDGRGVPGGPGRGRGGASDLGQMLDRSPVLTFTELKADPKGDPKNSDAIIVLGSVGKSPDQLNVITMLAGVEPILTKPGTREMSLGGWSLGGGGGEP